MDDLLREVKYELKRTVKHIFYVMLAVCFFACWYLVFALVTEQWNLREWSHDLWGLYWAVSIPTGFGYMIYRITS